MTSPKTVLGKRQNNIFVTYFADVRPFLGRTYFYLKKWFDIVHVTGAAFTS